MKYLALVNLLKMKTKKFLIVLFLLYPLIFLGFGIDNKDGENTIKHPKKVYRKTLRQIGNGNLSDAMQNLTILIAAYPDNYEYHIQMALLLFWDYGDYIAAKPYFEKAMKVTDNDNLKSDLLIFIAKCYQFDNQFEESSKLYQQYIDKHPDDKNMLLVANKAIEDNKRAMRSLKDIPKNFAMVKHFGKHINSRFPDYVPVLVDQDSSLLFTSRRPVTETPDSYFEAFDYPENIFISTKTQNGFGMAQLYLPQNFDGNFYNKRFRHHAIVNINYDETKMILYAKNKLWISEKDGNLWGKPQLFQKKINFSYYQPHACFSLTGDTLFFTSISQKDGLGNRDIYFSVKDNKGEWQSPQLMPNINTLFDEDSPEISPDGNSLYFSSKGLEGIGGYDIYVSNKINGEWQKPQNLGMPINSTGDDIFYKSSADGQTAFFSSWRKGGLGHMDIYQVVKQAQFKECVSLDSAIAYPLSFDCPDTVIAGKEICFGGNFSKMPNTFIDKAFWNFGLGNVKDSLVAYHTFTVPGMIPIKLEVFAFDTVERITKDFCVSKDLFVISNEQMLALNQTISKDSISSQLPDFIQIDTSYSETDTSKTTTITTSNMTSVTLSDMDSLTVYYDFDIRVFRKEMKPIVDNFIEKQIKSHLEQKIKIIGYTDYWGNYKCNFVLSKQRAETLKTYLINQGVDASRFVEIEGLGESKQITDESLLKEHKYCHTIPELNRRARIILLKAN